MNKIFYMFLTSILLLVSCKGNKTSMVKQDNDFDQLLLVGTYTAGTSKGVSIYKFNSKTGESKFVSETEVDNPSYLAVSADEKYVYTVSESGDNSKINAFGFDKEAGKLELINSQNTGADPCFVAIDPSGRLVVAANYSGGSISEFHVKEDGSLDVAHIHQFSGKGAHPERQSAPHLHNTIFSPDGYYMLANDLGMDKIYIYDVNEALSLKLKNEIALKPESGPRHSVFHPNERYMYTITELSGEVLVFSYDNDGEVLTQIQSVVADTLHAQGSGDIQITPDGKYLYASNRLKGDGLAIFSIDGSTGMLTKVGYQPTGIHPRNFVITANGELLLVANKDSNYIQVFKIGEDGLLTDTDQNIELSMPVCLKIVPLVAK